MDQKKQQQQQKKQNRRATKMLRERIALIFDFDDTLAPYTFPLLLDHLGIDRDPILDRLDAMEADGWRKPLAQVYLLLEEQRKGVDITRKKIEELGRSYPLFEGVEGMFDHLRRHLHETDPDIELEFYLLTAGFITIPEASPIGQEFEAIWGGQLHFDEEGRLAFVRSIVTHEEKMQYILQMAKGMHIKKLNQLEDAWVDPENDEDWHIPLYQVIYVGDGASDMSAFSLLNENGGVAIALAKGETEEWEGYEEMRQSRQVDNIAQVDFAEGSELMNSLCLSIDHIAKRIGLHRLAKAE